MVEVSASNVRFLPGVWLAVIEDWFQSFMIGDNIKPRAEKV